MKEARAAAVCRKTKETEVAVKINLDGGGVCAAKSGIAFLDHMLSQLALHGGLDLRLTARGDLAVDAHHTIEDCGIALGKALDDALGDKKSGIARYGFAFAPLDEALARAVVDLSGRGGLFWGGAFSRDEVGGFDSDLIREFFRALADNARATIHLDLLAGVNAHHQAEALFKAFALALKQAVARAGGRRVPSTKGTL
jgi:imidazoleglycerol-phosphate dehydratase